MRATPLRAVQRSLLLVNLSNRSAPLKRHGTEQPTPAAFEHGTAWHGTATAETATSGRSRAVPHSGYRPTQDAAMYRMRVIHRLPTLLMLDGTEVRHTAAA